MKDLFLSELRRFRWYAVAAAVAHLLLLVFLQRTSNLLQLTYFETSTLFALCMLLGLALGLVQVGSYRKPSQWLWLMHRPLPPRRIFMALALAGLALLGIAVLLPQWLLVAGVDLFSTRVVDSRHYLAPLHVLAFAMMAWLAASHAVLSRHKAAIVLLLVPLPLALHLVSVWWLLLPVLACLAWLGYVCLHSFRADREAPVKGTPALLLTALPLQLGFFLLAFGAGQMLFVTASILLGTDPLNTPYPPEGGLIEIERKEPAEVIVLGLQHSSDPRAASWREQLPLLEPVAIGPYLQRFPIRHQLSNLQLPTFWEDQQRGIVWTFSHDRMQFHGRDPRSGKDYGWWGSRGAGDTTPFTEVPIASHEGFLMTRDAAFAIDSETQRLHELLRLPEGEWFIEVPARALERLIVLTNRRLLAYRADRQAASPTAPPILDWQLPLPAGAAHLESAQLAALMDGWLVSFVYGDGHRQIGFSQYSVIAQPWQQVSFVDAEGHSQTVAQRQIIPDYPPMHRVPWWISPPLHVLAEWPESLLDKGMAVPLQPEVWPEATEFWLTAALLALASLLLALWWLRDARITPARRGLWLASCILIGLPAFFSLVCLQPRAPQG